jgi:phosphatidate phosphatase APP1
VISDLDDTVVQTGATSLLRMARTVFLSNARTRLPFPGVAAFYRALQHGAGESPFNPVFYVSSSPWNLHDLLTEFLVLRKIPLGPLMLRDWGISAQEALPTGHAGHKLEAIRRILDLFPALPFLLIGDSGQEDPEIYHRVVHDHPDRILAVYIRNVTPRPERAAAIRALAEEVEAAGSTLLLDDDTLGAARHAAERGWITPAALEEVAAESRAEHRDTPDGTDSANRALSTDGAA